MEYIMAKKSQMFVLRNLMVAAGDKGVSKAEAAKALNVDESCVGVYFFYLKRDFKAQYDLIKKGRQIVAYKLKNPDDVVVDEYHRKNSNKSTSKKVATKTTKAPAVKKQASVSDEDDSDSDVNVSHQFSEREFNDIKTSLGIL
jgi:hypothetical protein